MRVKPYQIVVVVSVNLQALMEWDPHMPGFPAILDTGNNHNLSISRRHLLRWAASGPRHCGSLGPFGNGSSKSLCMPRRSGCTRIGRGIGPRGNRSPLVEAAAGNRRLPG